MVGIGTFYFGPTDKKCKEQQLSHLEVRLVHGGHLLNIAPSHPISTPQLTIDVGRPPGEWFEIDPAEIPIVKLDDFSMHQLLTSNLLREVRQQTGIEVRVLACQTGPLPDQVCPGLSEPVWRALPHAAEWVTQEYFAATGESVTR